MKKRSILAGAILAALLSAYIGCVHYTEPHEVALVWNRFSGESYLDSRAGFHLTAPWIMAATIDTRPVRVCVTSAARSFNCKLIQFVTSEYEQFIKVQGIHYYWLSNRISFNLGYDEEYRGMKDILRGYTYSLEQYPFVVTLKTYSD
jgi:hypothetical protein